MLTSLVREPVTHSSDHASVTDIFAFEAILLAGTHAWRRTAFDQLLPRPVLPVAQLPLMAHPLRWLHAAGASRVTICANGGATQLREHLDPVQHLLPALTFHEDSSPRGAAGSARDAALASDADLFVVADATTIPDVSLLRVLLEHRESRAALTVIVQPSSGPRGTSLVPTGLYGTGLVPTGLYIFSRRAFEYVPAAGYQDIKESLIPRLYAAGELVVTSEAESQCPRVLDAKTYLAVSHRTIARSMQQLDPLGAPSLDGMPSIHPSAHVSPSALLVGPVLVGRGAEIHDDAVIVGPASIGAHSVVGRGALISRSVVWDHCTIAATATVDRSVLSSGVNVPAGANLVGAIQVGVRPAPAKDAVVVTPHPAMEPAVNARGLAFR